MLAAAFFFNQVDRALFSLLTVPIQADLGLSDVQIGAINTALFATLAVVIPFAGPLGDKFSRKWVITLSLMAWSAFTILTGFAGGFLAMVFFRSIAAGVGEACYFPSAVPLIASHHRETRSFALSVHQGMLYFGLIASGALIGWIYALFGNSWRAIFVLFGAAGLALGISFVWLLKDARQAGRDGSAQIPRTGAMAGVKAFFTCPSALLMTCGATAVVAVNNAYLAWGPKFAMAKHSLSIGDAGMGVMVWHHLFAFVSIYVAGIVADRYVRRWPRFRMGMQMTALAAGAPAIAFFGLAPSPVAAWTAASAYGAARGFFEANTYASMFDVIEERFRSTAVGLMAMCSFLVGSLSPLFIGIMGERAKSAVDPSGAAGYSAGFAVLGLLYLAGAVCMAAAFFKTFKKDSMERRCT